MFYLLLLLQRRIPYEEESICQNVSVAINIHLLMLIPITLKWPNISYFRKARNQFITTESCLLISGYRKQQEWISLAITFHCSPLK